MSVPLQKTIGLRLLRYVFGCYFAVTVIVTSIQLISEYTHVKENVFIELSHLGETLEDSLTVSIWNYDLEQIESILLGINKIAMVSSTKATDSSHKILASSGRIFHKEDNVTSTQQEGSFGKGTINKLEYVENGVQQTTFEYKFPIHFYDKDSDTRELIGYCYIYAQHSLIIERVKYGFALIIINSLIKTAALWFIFLFFAKRIISKPLNTLTQATKELDPNDPNSFRENDDLDKIYYSGHDDELHELTDSFLKMRNSISDKIDIIEQQNSTLEDRVRERTSTIEEVNRELKHLSLHDPLTGLPNRNLFHDRLEHLLKLAKRDNFGFAIASIDLRKFKEINDNFGHQAGDVVLKELATRMSQMTRGIDTIARMGGDEFAMLVQDVDQETIEVIAEKITSCTDQPILFENDSIWAGINIGFSIYPDHAEDANTLFKKADIAMYQAKKDGSSLAIFTPSVNQELERRDIIRQDLASAITKNQLNVFYQPIIKGKKHTIESLEALIRWQHPTLGFVPPDEFINVAERSNIIKLLTEWVSHRAMVDGEKFIENGHNVDISINISGRLINDITFPQTFKRIIDQHNFPATKIKLEITESSTMTNPQQALKTLCELKSLGVSLSIDDFGTGYSSFSYLSRLPVDELKIDRSFLIDFSENSQVIIEAIISLAHRLNLKVVAEGVETEEILSVIENLGCDFIQGYYFCRPIPPAELLEWIPKFIDNETNNS